MMDAIFALFFLIFVVGFIWLLFKWIGDMARARGHSPWPWWFISLAWSPFGSIFVLWLFFPTKEVQLKRRMRG